MDAAYLPIGARATLFRNAFRFTGGQIVAEFLMGLGHLPDAHEPDCPVYAHIARLSPPWVRAADT